MKKAQYVRQLSVSLPKQIIAQVKAITDKAQISMGEWVREAIQSKLNEPKKEESK